MELNNISKIIKREYLTRVVRISYIVTCILLPVLYVSLIYAPAIYSQISISRTKKIAIANQTIKLKNTNNLQFYNVDKSKLKEALVDSTYWGIIFFNDSTNNHIKEADFYTKNQSSPQINKYITQSLERENKKRYLENYYSKEMANSWDSINFNPILNISLINNKGDIIKNHLDLKQLIAKIGCFLIYFSIVFFGSQVMNGIIEEKRSRVVEIIISSVSQFDLMAGKIIGIGLVGLSQFIIWIALSILLTISINTFLINEKVFDNMNSQEIVMNGDSEISDSSHMDLILSFSEYDYVTTATYFIFFFVFGYLFYAAMFAAIGAISNPDTNTQSLNILITIPLISTLILSFNSFGNESGSLLYYLSFLPLTSPIAMMSRIPYGVPFSQILISLVLLVFSFVAMTYISAKIYRMGILKFGKKTDFKEIVKWFKY